MLNSVEINHLEKRWQRWKLKSIISKSLVVSIALCIIPLVWLLIYYVPMLFSQPNNQIENEKKNITTIAKKENTKNSNIKDDSEKQKKTIETAKDTAVIEQPMNEEELIEYVKANKKYPNHTKEQVMEEEYIELEPDDYTQEEYAQEEPKKPTIEITTKSIDTSKDDTHNLNDIDNAIKLAEKFYKQKEYKKSQKWALSANNMDPKNEKSWIIFAKSIAKNGEPKKAIKALSAYLKINPKASNVSSLIRKIKHGDY